MIVRRPSIIALVLLLAAPAVAQSLRQQIPIPVPASMGGVGSATIGTMASQNANAVALSGGTVNGIAVGGTVPATGTFTTLANTGALVDSSYSYQAPTNAFSITVGAGVSRLVLNPAGTLVAGTVTLTAAPVDGQVVVIKSSQIVTTLTISPNSGQSALGLPVTIALGGSIECIYRAALTTWFC